MLFMCVYVCIERSCFKGSHGVVYPKLLDFGFSTAFSVRFDSCPIQLVSDALSTPVFHPERDVVILHDEGRMRFSKSFFLSECRGLLCCHCILCCPLRVLLCIFTPPPNKTIK